ncbi:hypothetical protein EON67_05165 [archaeon]|nr:MAG: hypothetical protein EON67_05165 [archaeon]
MSVWKAVLHAAASLHEHQRHPSPTGMRALRPVCADHLDAWRTVYFDVYNATQSAATAGAAGLNPSVLDLDDAAEMAAMVSAATEVRAIWEAILARIMMSYSVRGVGLPSAPAVNR